MEVDIATQAPIALPQRATPTHRRAVIDLGSNTARVMVSDVSTEGIVHVVDEEAITLGLGRELAAEGQFNDRLLARVLEVLEDFDLIARAAGAESVVAVGTAALRAAPNVRALVRVAERRLGIPIEVVDGAEEARLAFDGALFGLPLENGILLDLGGGSIEVVEFRGRRLTKAWSLPLGALRIADEFLKSDPPAAGEIRLARRHIRRALDAADLGPMPEGGTLVGTGGSIRNLARIDRRRQSYPIPRLQGYELPVQRLRRITTRLLRIPVKERAATPGLNPERSHSIAGGALVLEEVAARFGVDLVMTSGEGLREGRARDLRGRDLPPVEHIRAAALEHLRAPLPEPERHRLEWLTALSVDIHRALGADASTIDLLRDAAVLIGLGGALDFYNRGSRASDVVLTAVLPGFSHLEIARVAAVLRLVEREDAPLSNLRPLVSPDEHPELRRCAAILVLADALLRRTPAEQSSLIDVALLGPALSIQVPAWPVRTTDDPAARVRALFGVNVEIGTKRRR